MSFPYTALLVMTHNKTGLKYFCKTTRINEINWYKGSGIHWKRHLKIHGRDVSVGVVGFYNDRQRCIDAAIAFSQENDITKSSEWANLIDENGIDGAGPNELHPLFGKPSTQKGVKRPWVGRRGPDNPMFGKPSPMRGVSKPKGKDSPLYGRKRPEGGGKPPHPVIGIDVNGVETYYESVGAAARTMNGTRAGIHKCCNGKAKTAHGHTWRYAIGDK